MINNDFIVSPVAQFVIVAHLIAVRKIVCF